MKVISLFDGMSCGLVALKRARLSVTSYRASEIDKYAMLIAKKNHPEIEPIGPVESVRGEWCDLLIGGSPCQGFSNAGEGLNFNDPRSKLFFEFVRVLEECRAINPNVKFLLENVKMKKEWRDIISKALGVEPVLINSALVSAQHRERYYWCNWDLVQPKDRGIRLD